jgi:pantoate--beta-alanine ligase
VSLPTVREQDGLALSSRNSYLTPVQRKAATVLYQSLLRAKKDIARGIRDATVISSHMEDLIEGEPLARVDYVAVIDPDTLQRVERVEKEVLVAVAAKIGQTRLIDNLKIG